MAAPVDPPLFMDEAEIGRRLLGARRAAEWKALAPLYERRGFPKIDAVMGGRYWPAILRFFNVEYGLEELRPMSPSGREDAEAWRASPNRGRPRRSA